MRLSPRQAVLPLEFPSGQATGRCQELPRGQDITEGMCRLLARVSCQHALCPESPPLRARTALWPVSTATCSQLPRSMLPRRPASLKSAALAIFSNCARMPRFVACEGAAVNAPPRNQFQPETPQLFPTIPSPDPRPLCLKSPEDRRPLGLRMCARQRPRCQLSAALQLNHDRHGLLLGFHLGTICLPSMLKLL